MRVDHDRREVRAEQDELRDHTAYIRAQEWQAQTGYPLVIEPPYSGKLVPQNALIVSREELGDNRRYQELEAQAKAENKVLCPE